MNIERDRDRDRKRERERERERETERDRKTDGNFSINSDQKDISSLRYYQTSGTYLITCTVKTKT